MTIYSRYFRVTSGPLMDRARGIETANEAARHAAASFCKEIGAENALSHRDGRWAGFKFASTPDQSVWKQPNSFAVYWPRKNSAAGRDMLARIEALPRIVHIEEALEQVGLQPSMPAVIHLNTWRAPTLVGSPKLGVLFVCVPWRDEDPETMANYKRDRKEGMHSSIELDHLCWEATTDMIELKRWEVEKEIEELNRQIKVRNQLAAVVEKAAGEQS